MSNSLMNPLVFLILPNICIVSWTLSLSLITWWLNALRSGKRSSLSGVWYMVLFESFLYGISHAQQNGRVYSPSFWHSISSRSTNKGCSKVFEGFVLYVIILELDSQITMLQRLELSPRNWYEFGLKLSIDISLYILKGSSISSFSAIGATKIIGFSFNSSFFCYSFLISSIFFCSSYYFNYFSLAAMICASYYALIFIITLS